MGGKLTLCKCAVRRIFNEKKNLCHICGGIIPDPPKALKDTPKPTKARKDSDHD